MIIKTNSFFDFFYLMAVISVSLGVTNIFPIPGLDGGKVLILLIEIIRKKKVSEEFELKLSAIGFLLLITLAVYVTINDVGRLF